MIKLEVRFAKYWLYFLGEHNQTRKQSKHITAKGFTNLQFLKKFSSQKPFWDDARLSSLVNKWFERYSAMLQSCTTTQFYGVTQVQCYSLTEVQGDSVPTLPHADCCLPKGRWLGANWPEGVKWHLTTCITALGSSMEQRVSYQETCYERRIP